MAAFASASSRDGSDASIPTSPGAAARSAGTAGMRVSGGGAGATTAVSGGGAGTGAGAAAGGGPHAARRPARAQATVFFTSATARLVAGAQHAAGVAGGHHVRREVAGDHASGADHGVVAHGHAGEEDRPAADPDAVA